MSEFQFAYTIDLKDTKPFVKKTLKNKYMCDGMNLLEYITEDEINEATNIIVFGKSRLTWFKGKDKVYKSQVWCRVNTPLELNSDRVITRKNVYVSWLPTPVWDFDTLTSDYHRKKGQHYIEVSLEDGSGEMDVLQLASSLTHQYGYFFTPHTVSESKGKYHITVETDADVNIDIFSEIASHKKEINKNLGLSIECKVRKSEGKEANQMPTVPSEDEWDW